MLNEKEHQHECNKAANKWKRERKTIFERRFEHEL